MRSLTTSSLFACLLLLRAPAACGGGAVEDWEKDLQREVKLRIARHIQGLDAPTQYREKQMRALVEAGRGEHAELVLDMLHNAFSYDNPQIREGVVDVLARIGRPASVPVLARQLRYETFLDIRLRILGILPIFLLPHRPNVQAELLVISENENYAMTDRLRSILRRGPVRVTGGVYDPVLHHLRQSIVAAVAEQLDPIGAAIRGVDSKRDDPQARETLRILCGTSMGRTREDWLQAWEAQRVKFHSPLDVQLATVQTRACRVLADIGAEGTEAVLAELEGLLRLPRPTANEAALRMTAALAAVAWQRLDRRAAASEQPRRETADEAEQKWREDMVAAAKRTTAFALRVGLRKADAEHESVRAAAYACLGACRQREAVEALRRRWVQGGESPGLQVSIARALGEIGGERALEILSVLVERKPYADTDQALADEYRLVVACLKAIGRMAGRYDPETGRFRLEDRGTGRLAFGHLLALLKEDRVLAGGPRRESGQPLRIRDLALHQIQLVTGLAERAFSTKVWQGRYESLLKVHMAVEEE